MDDRALLEAAGEALFPARWKVELARALGVDDRSLRRWLQTGVIPQGVWQDILGLARQRQGALHALCEQITERASPDS